MSRFSLPSWSGVGGAIALARGADALARFALFLTTARVLAPRDFSTYALLTAALATCQWALSLGAPRVALYFHARGVRGPLYAWLYFLAAGASVAVAILVAALPTVKDRVFPGVPPEWIWLGLAPLPFSLLADSLAATLLSEGRTRAYAMTLWARNLGTAVVLATSLSAPDRLLWILAGRVAVQGMVAALTAWAARAQPRWESMARFSADALRYGVPTALSDAAVAMHRRADVFLLSLLGRGSEIGAYALAYGIAETFWLLTDSFEAALFVDIARKDQPRAKAAARRGFRLYLLLGAVGLVGGIAAGEALLWLAFRDRYPRAPTLLPWLVAAAVVWGVSRPFYSLLASLGRVGTSLACHCTGLAINVAANLFCIPRWGASGAAIACFASYAAESALFGIVFGRVSRQTSKRSPMTPGGEEPNTYGGVGPGVVS